jgi:hypothetical protein
VLRPLLYICAPWRNRTAESMGRVREAVAKALTLGWTPIFAPWLWDAKGPDGNWMLDDAKPEQRAVALECCRMLIRECTAFLVVQGEMTDGMRADIAAWQDEVVGDEVDGTLTIDELTRPECGGCGVELTRDQLEAHVPFCEECAEAINAGD